MKSSTTTFSRVFFLLVFSCVMVVTSNAQINSQLKFDKQGRFKIVQFTDIHMKEYNISKRDSVIMLMESVLSAEKPDLVVLTGDICTSENVEAAWRVVTKPIIDAKIPWAVVFGNHDSEHNYSNKQIMEFLLTLPYNYSQIGPNFISGSGNYVLEIKSSQNDQIKALLYCLDSNNYTGEKDNKELGKYGWIKFDQINWYRETSKSYTLSNNCNPYPALAFFHIPLPEYEVVANFETTVGVKFENVASPVINSGMYNALYESKDVMGVFVGHDHNNDYIGSLNGICLAYGCKTGLESYGKLVKGSRVIVLYEGERKFDSWLHNYDESKKNFVSYPATFEKKK